MKKSIIIDLLILVGIAVLIWGVFTIFPIIPDDSGIEVSIEQEEKFGKLIVDNIIYDNPGIKVISNKLLDSAMNIIMMRLETGLHTSDYDYKIILIESKTINAAALPGGYILVFSELINITEKPEELAAVIAHEIGHVEKRHVISRIIKELGLSILLNGDSMVLCEVFKYATSTAFSRQQESEADDFSLKLMEKSRIHPIVMATIFRKFKEKIRDYPDNLEILSTHPNINSRIKAAMNYKVKKNFKSNEFELDWERIKEVIKY